LPTTKFSIASEISWTRLPAPGLLDADGERFLRLVEEARDCGRDGADGNRRGGVADPAVEDDADVELDDVGVLDAARAADAVDDLVVDRDADVAGKAAIIEEGAAAAFLDQRRRACRSRRWKRLVHDGPGNFLEDFAGRAATGAHAFDFVRRFDRDGSRGK
jgi:hypothetical protein